VGGLGKKIAITHTRRTQAPWRQPSRPCCGRTTWGRRWFSPSCPPARWTQSASSDILMTGTIADLPRPLPAVAHPPLLSLSRTPLASLSGISSTFAFSCALPFRQICNLPIPYNPFTIVHVERRPSPPYSSLSCPTNLAMVCMQVGSCRPGRHHDTRGAV